MHAEAAKELIDQGFLIQVAELFNLDATSVKYVGGFENNIYEGLLGEQPVIIRIIHNDHRTVAQIESELHWLRYLQDNGASVCGPFTSDAGNLVETLVVGDTPLHISVFAKAPGARIKISQERGNTELFQAWGRATGQLHRLTQSYRRPPEFIPRGNAVDNFRETLAPWIPQEPELRDKITGIVESVVELPKTKDWYGLIHSDIHSGNFFYDAGRLHIFDFDDCAYHQLVSDIAIPVYYAIWANNLATQAEIDEFGQFFACHFLHGYLTQHTLSMEQIQTIPLLLQFRDCELLTVLLAEFGSTMTDKQAALIDTFKSRILENKLIVNVDWTKLLEDEK